VGSRRLENGRGGVVVPGARRAADPEATQAIGGCGGVGPVASNPAPTQATVGSNVTASTREPTAVCPLRTVGSASCAMGGDGVVAPGARPVPIQDVSVLSEGMQLQSE